MAELNNPFPADAVATYPGHLTTCSTLNYILPVEELLHNYLESYPRKDRRFGGAIGIKGGHGGGKTHLLTWIGDQAVQHSKLNSIVLYAKADRDNYFDLYTDIMSRLPRTALQTLLAETYKQVGIDLVQKARITESIADRIKTPEDLPQLYKEGNLDNGKLNECLQERLLGSGLPPDIWRTVLQIDSPATGEIAYQWLAGKKVETLSDISLSFQLSEMSAAMRESSTPDAVAIDALETIAFFAQIAKCPLILLVDQLEVLLAPDSARLNILYSVTKKLFENLGRRDAFIIVAGTDDAWEQMRRDVAPRMRSREPVQIGNLSEDETSALLEAYTEGLGRFPATTLGKIQSLSGGNPREVLRIAHHAFRATGGRLDRLTDEIIVRSAQNAGTVDDRERLAISVADRVFSSQTGYRVLRTVAIADGLVLSRVVTLGDNTRVAVLVVKATDNLSELDSAKRVTEARKYLSDTLPGTHLIVVSVGYSSREVSQILRSTAMVLEFDDITFSSQLKALLLQILSSGQAQAQKVDSPSPDYQSVNEQLDKLSVRRKRGDQELRARVVERVEEVSAPKIQERELKTRRQMQDELSSLDLRLADHDGQLLSEAGDREIIRSLLISNESYVKSELFEQLGDIYIDNATPVRLGMRGNYTFNAVVAYRRALIERLRAVLRRSSTLDRLLDNPLLSALTVSVGATLLVTLLRLNMYEQYFLYETQRFNAVSELIVSVVKTVITYFILTGVVSSGLIYTMRYYRIYRWKTRGRHITAMLEQDRLEQ